MDDQNKKKKEQEDLASTNEALKNEVSAAHDEGIKSVADFVSRAESERTAKLANDKDYQRREEAYRYISGLGDTLSGVANLIGTAHGASNQPQQYNAPEVIRKAQEAREKRVKEIDDLGKRIDEMRMRESQLKQAKTLEMAKLNATSAKEQMELAHRQAKEAEEARRYKEQVAFSKEKFDYQKQQDAQTQANREAELKAQTERFNKDYSLRLQQLQETIRQNKDKSMFPILVGGKMLNIPMSEVNNANIPQVFNALPDEVKSMVVGKPIMDESGAVVGNEPPTLEQMIAAIGVAAESNPAIQKKLYQMAGLPMPSGSMSAAAASTYSAAPVIVDGLETPTAYYEKYKADRKPGSGVMIDDDPFAVFED